MSEFGRQKLASVFAATLLCLHGLSLAMEPAAANVEVRPGLPALITQLRPSVLLVGTYGETDAPRFQFRGSGFVAGRNNLVITNAHVLPEAPDNIGTMRRLVVQASTGINQWAMREVEVIKIDREHDLALLKVAGSALPALPLAPDAAVQEGISIALLGFPIAGALGFSLVTHKGIVSSIAAMALPQAGAQGLNERSIRTLRAGSSFNILQLDATAYPGNSGGPVVDVDSGAVVGVVSMVLLKGTRETAITHPSGISYAVPVDAVRRLLATVD